MDMNRGAAAEAINALVAYKFQSMKICDGDVVQDGGGVLAAGTEKERTISAEDAVSFFLITYLCCALQIFIADIYFLLDL
jgi:hypothetical protein